MAHRPVAVVATGYLVSVFLILCLGAALQLGAQPPAMRRIAIDTRLAADAHLHVGDTVLVSGQPGAAITGGGDSVIVGAILEPPPDPSQVARDAYHIRLHLDELQRLTGEGDRVDRFAVRTAGGHATTSALQAINDAAFGFHAYRSDEIAVGTSKTFQVVSRFHRAIALITIVASGIFLLCLLILRVDERRREIAALRLMGISRRSVLLSIVLEAAIIAVVGSAIGTVVGWAGSLVINWHYRAVYRTPLTFALVTTDIVRWATVLAVTLGVGAGLIVGRRLVRRPPLALFGR